MHNYNELNEAFGNPPPAAQAAAQDVERQRMQADNLLELDLRVLGRVVSRMPRREQYTILDAGCAHGYVAKTRFPRLGIPFHCLGVDNCAETVAQARQGNQDNRFLFTCAEIEDLDSEDYGRFDIIFAEYALHHAADPALAMQQLWNLLAPGGAMIVRAIDDGMHSIHPSRTNLDLLLHSTAHLARGTDRHFARKLQSRLLRLLPTPSDLFVEFKVENTTGMTPLERRRFFENAFAYNEESAHRMLRNPDSTDETRALAKAALQDSARQREEFAEDPDLFFAVAHSVAVAFK